MEKAAIKDLMYGGIEEIIRNPKFYRYSQVASNYSKFTEDGEQAIMEYLNTLAHTMYEAETADLDRRAKDMVIKELTK